MLSLAYFLFTTVLFVAVIGQLWDTTPDTADRCQLRRDRGVPCFGVKLPSVKWYYDADEDNCLPFIHTGCGGNRNKFPSEGRCLRLCSGACYDDVTQTRYMNGDSRPNTCGSCICNNGVWNCPANPECLNAMLDKSCDLILCLDADKCLSGQFYKDERDCPSCLCKELEDIGIV